MVSRLNYFSNKTILGLTILGASIGMYGLSKYHKASLYKDNPIYRMSYYNSTHQINTVVDEAKQKEKMQKIDKEQEEVDKLPWWSINKYTATMSIACNRAWQNMNKETKTVTTDKLSSHIDHFDPSWIDFVNNEPIENFVKKSTGYVNKGIDFYNTFDEALYELNVNPIASGAVATTGFALFFLTCGAMIERMKDKYIKHN